LKKSRKLPESTKSFTQSPEKAVAV
jgi:hypothetical protein